MRSTATLQRRFADVAVNLTDCVFHGVDWKGKRIHEDDFECVLDRARAAGVTKILVSGTSLDVCKRAMALCQQHRGFLYCTVGIHPAHADDFLLPSRVPPPTPQSKKAASKQKAAAGTSAGAEQAAQLAAEAAIRDVKLSIHDPVPGQVEHASALLDELRHLIAANRDVVAAIGEIGLDYSELRPPAHTPAVQHDALKLQLTLAEETGLPLFLHSRGCGLDFVDCMEAWLSERGLPTWPSGGAVHSFNGTPDELKRILAMGFHVGINASAFRTEAVARDVLTHLPLTRLLIETDAPWCDVRPEDWGARFVKTVLPTRPKTDFVLGECVARRNEPAHMVQVAEVLHGALIELGLEKGDSGDGDDLTEALFENALKAFPLLRDVE